LEYLKNLFLILRITFSNLESYSYNQRKILKWSFNIILKSHSKARERFWCIYFRGQGPRARNELWDIAMSCGISQWVVGYRNELWDIAYQMSSVICKFSTSSFGYISLKKITRKSYISYWINDSKYIRKINFLPYYVNSMQLVCK
jgi:hypothetical protein